MRKVSFFACSAFAALMFAACGDDPVTGAAQPIGGNGGQGPVAVLDSTRNVSLNLGGCYEHPYDALMRSLAPSKAYLVIDEAGHHVVIPNIEEACGYADIVFNNQRVLDTLKINFVGDPTDCMCVTDDWFNIDPIDADIKYLVYQNTVYEVVTEPLPVRSSSSVVIESSSEMALSSAVVSSSSVMPELSSSSADVSSSSETLEISSSSVVVSSSSAEPDPSHVIVTDATAYCRTTSNIDPMLDGASGVADRSDAALPPVAYRYVGGTRIGFTLENISMTCNVEIEKMEVYESEETIYVKPKLDYTNAQRCLCESRLQFSLPVEAIFYTAKYLVLDDGSSVNFQNKMEIYDMDVITIDEVEGKTPVAVKDFNAGCNNNKYLTTGATKLDNSLLPVFDKEESEGYAFVVEEGDDYMMIEMDDLQYSCGTVFEGFEVKAANDTLYVESFVDPSSPVAKCLCPTRIQLKVAKNELTFNSQYLILDKYQELMLVRKTAL